MKISKNHLRKVIREEIRRSHYRRLRLLKEGDSRTVQMITDAYGSLWKVMKGWSKPVMSQIEAAGIPILSVYSDMENIGKLTDTYDSLPPERQKSKGPGLADAIAGFFLSSMTVVGQAPTKPLEGLSIGKAILKMQEVLVNNDLNKALAGDVAEFMLWGMEGPRDVGRSMRDTFVPKDIS